LLAVIEITYRNWSCKSLPHKEGIVPRLGNWPSPPAEEDRVQTSEARMAFVNKAILDFTNILHVKTLGLEDKEE
jgi:hypothetical protein